MSPKDLEIFDQMPFLFWVKDDEGRYVWGNRVINELAGEIVVGKTDDELIWAQDAQVLQADDKQVMTRGKPLFRHEIVAKSTRGNTTLNVCKFVGELDGKKQAFGISFVIDE